jgi:hypothetical protein
MQAELRKLDDIQPTGRKSPETTSLLLADYHDHGETTRI